MKISSSSPSACCEKVGLKKGPWTADEDQKLLDYIQKHGHGSWRALPAKSGLRRCGKSCRLRWTNYLRPDIKRGHFTLQEQRTIIQLHALLGNRWSVIATHLPKRTDNEIKNYWNTFLKKKLTKMGIDPVTHKPKVDALNPGQLKVVANISHMTQWESARLEAEARLNQKSMFQISYPFQSRLSSSWACLQERGATIPTPTPLPYGLDVLTTWRNAASTLESPTSTLVPKLEDLPNNGGKVCNFGEVNQAMDLQENGCPMDIINGVANNNSSLGPGFMDEFSDIFLENGSNWSGSAFEENKHSWDSVMSLVNCSPFGSTIF